ncbi:hypothetical protein AB1N83_007491 [Pleurotus pulmonarius]
MAASVHSDHFQLRHMRPCVHGLVEDCLWGPLSSLSAGDGTKLNGTQRCALRDTKAMPGYVPNLKEQNVVCNLLRRMQPLSSRGAKRRRGEYIGLFWPFQITF